MTSRNQEAVIQRAKETEAQITSAFGRNHLLTAKAADLVLAVEAEVARRSIGNTEEVE